MILSKLTCEKKSSSWNPLRHLFHKGEPRNTVDGQNPAPPGMVKTL